MEEPKYELKPEVAKQYEIVGDQVKADFPGWGLIDLREMTLDGAKDLVERGFPYLKKKAKATKE